jgi:hypothetical protein
LILARADVENPEHEIRTLARSGTLSKRNARFVVREAFPEVSDEEFERLWLDGMPPLIRLDEFLATPDSEVQYRVEGLWPSGGRFIAAAAWKAGKTTLLGNLIRSLVDGDPFLERFTVHPVDRIVLLDDELDENKLRRWLREQGIRNPARVHLATLRGRVAEFDIIDPKGRARWAEHIGPADVLLLDCLRPVLDALRLAESNEVGQFLVAFDALLKEAGIDEAGIVHHMGHAGERSRGDSRLRDWPDAEWRLVREKGTDQDEIDPAAPRYFSAYGRDVDQPEQRLGYDPVTRHLCINGGSRKDAAVQEKVKEVVAFVKDNPGCNGKELEEGVPGNATVIRKARDLAVHLGLITVTPKDGTKPRIHHPVPSFVPSSSFVRDEGPTTSSASSLRPTQDEGRSKGSSGTGEINWRDEVDVPCEVCGERLDPWLTAHGEITHPFCVGDEA